MSSTAGSDLSDAEWGFLVRSVEAALSDDAVAKHAELRQVLRNAKDRYLPVSALTTQVPNAHLLRVHGEANLKTALKKSAFFELSPSATTFRRVTPCSLASLLGCVQSTALTLASRARAAAGAGLWVLFSVLC